MLVKCRQRWELMSSVHAPLSWVLNEIHLGLKHTTVAFAELQPRLLKYRKEKLDGSFLIVMGEKMFQRNNDQLLRQKIISFSWLVPKTLMGKLLFLSPGWLKWSYGDEVLDQLEQANEGDKS